MLPTQEKKLKEFDTKFKALEKAFAELIKISDPEKIQYLSSRWCDIVSLFKEICNRMHKV